MSAGTANLLAHGGTAGAVAEALFLGVPILVFVLLSRWSKRKAAAREQARLGDTGEAGDDEEREERAG